jgi:murein DD-endopeptidase
MALYAATGFLARTTADDLYKRYFTINSPSEAMIRAAFWVTQKPQNHGELTVPAGTATHVAGVVGRGGVVLSSEGPYAVVSTIGTVPPGGRIIAVRGLNMGLLEARSGREVYDLDPAFREYFEA